MSVLILKVLALEKNLAIANFITTDTSLIASLEVSPKLKLSTLQLTSFLNTSHLDAI